MSSKTCRKLMNLTSTYHNSWVTLVSSFAARAHPMSEANTKAGKPLTKTGSIVNTFEDLMSVHATGFSQTPATMRSPY